MSESTLGRIFGQLDVQPDLEKTASAEGAAEEAGMEKVAAEYAAAGTIFGRAAGAAIIEKLAMELPVGGHTRGVEAGKSNWETISAKLRSLCGGDLNLGGDEGNISARAEDVGAIKGSKADPVNKDNYRG